MEDFTIILGEIIAKMDLTIIVNSQIGNKIFVCKTLYLNTQKTVTDSQGNKYKVSNWLNNNWIELTPIGAAPNPFNDTLINCPPPTYLHGTPSSTNDEFSQIEVRMGAKTPLIWLYENYREKKYGKGSSLEREISPRIFFLDQANSPKWTTEEHHRQAVQPMANLADLLAETIGKDRRFKSIENIEIVPRPRFGVFVDDRGNDRKILDSDLSGVEMQPTLEKYKVYGCECN